MRGPPRPEALEISFDQKLLKHSDQDRANISDKNLSSNKRRESYDEEEKHHQIQEDSRGGRPVINRNVGA